MTREEILAMKPGRELDILVAEKVLGWQWVHGVSLKALYSPSGHKGAIVWDNGPRWDFDALPRYSTDIAAAMEVLETMLPSPLIWREHEREPHGWHVRLRTKHYHLGAEIVCETLPEAICKASLLALGKEDEDPVLEEGDAT